jgi:hypothetical protein
MYSVQKVIDLIAEKQLLGETLPELSNDRIEAIAESIMFDWEEDYNSTGPQGEYNDLVKWNLEQNLTHW